MAIPWTYSVRSVAVRKGASAMAVGGIALVVVVFVFLFALAEGFRRAVETSGSPRNIVVLRKGADAEMQSQVSRATGRVVEQLPCVARDGADRPLLVYESVVAVVQDRKDGGKANVAMRGTAARARDVHTEVRLTRGRWFAPGAAEAVIGAAVARRLGDLAVGRTIFGGGRDWTIVGVFEAAGSALESEVWMDIELFQAAFKRGSTYSSLLFRAAGDPKEASRLLARTIEADPRLRSMQATTEKEYYEKQSRLMAAFISVLGGLLTLVMAIGGIVGAMNTMYAAVQQRQREIGCLLAMGFPPSAIWGTFVLESLVLGALGAALGCLLSMPFHGMQTGTMNWATFAETAFEFRITPGTLAMASVIAIAMGFVGGLLPAVRGSRMKVVDALRRA